MRRRVIAAVWIAGATVPLLAAVVFLAGCCVLHEVMPVCHVAMSAMDGGQEDTAPARERQSPAKRMVTALPYVVRLGAVTTPPRIAAPTPSSDYRSFITLGAVRCDHDVGLHVLVATFLI